MENNNRSAKEALLESINNFSFFKRNIQKINLSLKESKKYEKNILKYFNPEKDEKFLKFTFLFFFQHYKWINPYNINLFLFESHFKLVKNEYDDKIECLIINKIDSHKILKLFIYWYFYLLNEFGGEFDLNNDKITNDNDNKIYSIKDKINILSQTNNKILNIYRKKKLNTEEIFIFLYIYLFFIEYYIKIINHENQLKKFNSILIKLFFILFEKITINILSDNENIDQAKNNIKIFIEFLKELQNNSLVLNEYNIITILDNNIIQSFINNILVHINPIIINTIFPSFSDKLADFYSFFLKFRFIKGKVMDFLINNTKNALINLKYFTEEKEKIINDVFIQNFQSDLIQKIFNQENKKLEHPNFSSFLFNGNNSKMSIALKELSLNDNIIIFSFHIKPNINDSRLFNSRQPLFCFYNHNKEILFKLLLKRIEPDINIDKNDGNKINNININSKKNKFMLNIINNKNKEIVLNELEIIESNCTYFICIHLNNSFIKLYLYSSSIDSKLLRASKEIKTNFNIDKILLNIGFDENSNQKEYFSGFIGNFYVIKLNNYKNKINYENNQNIIEKILLLKEFYRYIIYYLKLDNNIEIKTEYNLDYILFYKNKNEISIFKNLENIKKSIKNLYESILCLYPGLFKFLYLNEKDAVKNIAIPKISGVCEKQSDFLFKDINITFVKYDLSNDIFLMKNGFNYFCLQFEYFFQFANHYILFINKKQDIKEQNNDLKFYEENLDLFIKITKSSINKILILIAKYIVDLNIINFSIFLKQIFSALLAAMKSLNNINNKINIIDTLFHQIFGLFIIVCDKIDTKNELYSNNMNLTEKNTNDIEFLISFRDGLIDFLLTSDFYLNAPPQFLDLLFQKIISIIESNNNIDITVTNSNIFIKVLNLTPLLYDLFFKFDAKIYKCASKNTKGKYSLIYIYLILIKGLIITKRNNSNDDIFYKQLFIYSLRDYKDNQYISYTFLNIIYDLLNEGFFLDEDEIEELINYYDEIKNNEGKLDFNGEKEENPDKFKNDLFSLIFLILINNIFDKNKKSNLNLLFNEIYKIEFNDSLIISIINEMLIIISKNLDSKNMSVIKNMNNITNLKRRKRSNSNTSNITFDNFNYMSFYEDIFDLILLLFRIKYCKGVENKEENNNKVLMEEETKNNNENQINLNKPDRIKLELINLIFFIEEMLSAQINNDNCQITTIYSLINLIKLIHIITFDDKLIYLYEEDKFLLLFKNLLELCKNSKIIYTNYYICPSEKSSLIYKTIPETIFDICIKIITSDTIKIDKKNNIYQEDILTKNKILEYLYDIFLNEKNIKKDKKENENKKRSLFCYNDIYRYIFSQKITNIENEINKINKDKILNKYFTKFGKEIVKIYHINNLLLNKEKQFNFNFITFNIEKIYKFLNNLEQSCTIKNKLSEFFEKLLIRIINEHKILKELNKDDFFFKTNSNYNNYNFIKNKIQALLNEKKFDDITIREILDKKYIEKVTNIYEFVTSGLCENINEKKKTKRKSELNKSYVDIKPEKNKIGKMISSIISSNRNKSKNILNNDNLNISPPITINKFNSVNNTDSGTVNINYSRSNSLASGSDTSSANDEVESQSESSSNNNYNLNFSPENGGNNDHLSSSGFISTEYKTANPNTHVRNKSNYSLQTVLPSNRKMSIKNQIDGNSSSNFKKQSYKKNLFQDINEINNYCFFNKVDFMYLFNVKRYLMKNIFSLNFLDTIFYDKTFLELQKLFIQNYGQKIEFEKQENKYLNYPTKIKNFSNGIEPPLFVKPFNNFYEHKTFPITHEYFYNYIQDNKKKYKNRYINLFQKSIIIPIKEKECEYKCELIKIDHAIYGNILYSKTGNYLYFSQEDFESLYNSKKNEIYFDGIFSLSYMKLKEKENENRVTKYKTNRLVPTNKNILILLSEIDEIVERRFLLMWQGFEIYLKDGRSYFFNMLNETKFQKFKSILLENNEINAIMHKKDYLSKHKLITTAWEKNRISNYEYLLFVNKYGSRSFNETNQYYIFPWIITKFKNLIYINNNEKKIYDENRKQSTNSNKDINKGETNTDDFEVIKSLRDFKYPVSLQTESNRRMAKYRYSDDDEVKFKFHLGTHYSTAPFVYYYLMRQEPYSTLLIKLQNYQQENPNRMFIGIKETVEILESGNDNRELIPEFFGKIEFFLNLNCSFFGLRANNRIVNNLVLSFMKEDKKSLILISDYVHLIFEHKKLLNSDLVSENINEWINNIFGVGQLPNEKNRLNCCNIFRKTTYENETNLIEKVKKYKKELNKYDIETIRRKLTNKMDLIISFGQTPYQIFNTHHSKKLNTSFNNKNNNLGYNKKYDLGKKIHDDEEEDIFEVFSQEYLRPSFYDCSIQKRCLCFEINISLNKIFALSFEDHVIEINFQLIDEEIDMTSLAFQNIFKIPHIKFFDNKTIKQNKYYVYMPKYAFSSLKCEIENDINSSRKSSQISKDSSKVNINKDYYNFNIYYKQILENMNINKGNIEKNNEESYKFIQCRYLDNSFKLYKVTKIKYPKKKEKEKELIINSYSYICEDFVSSCCSISSNEFIIGLDNGKLIKWNIIEDEKNNIIKLNFSNNIQAHKSRINAIEIDQRLGLIITCGNDNYVQIRKLYNFELLTPIQINKKYIVTMAKVSNNNFLYIRCFNRKEKISVILGYTLTGIKFAKSQNGYYCNIDFTKSGNIVTYNYEEIIILNAYNLKTKLINEEEPEFIELLEANKKVKGADWLEYNYYSKRNNYEESNVIVYIKNSIKKVKEKIIEENKILYHDFKGNKIFE